MTDTTKTSFKLPPRPKLIKPEPDDECSPPSPAPKEISGRGEKFSSGNKPRVSDAPPHTQFAVIPSRAITDPRINRRKPLLLLLGAIGIHASAKGICYPSQTRLADLCGRSRSWAGKYLRELQKLGYVRRLAPPKYRGPRTAWRLQLLWRADSPVPAKEALWNESVWCWKTRGYR